MRMGMGEVALDRLRRRYAKMVESELTTLWEGWGLGAEGFGGGTYNHAWSGGPLTILSQRVAGVEPAEVGWGRYRLSPQLSGLDSVLAGVPVPGGTLEVEWTRTADGATQGEIRPPEGLAGELLLPEVIYGRPATVTIDGQAVDGQPSREGMRYVLKPGPKRIVIAAGR